MWVSDRLDRKLKNIFALHDEVAGLIAKNLSLKLGASSAASKVPVNPEAYELYVQAHQAWNLQTGDGFDRAESLLTRALALEPDFARAHVALADVWRTRLTFAPTTKAESDAGANSAERARIAERIARALALDPELAEAHASLGIRLHEDGRTVEVESALRKAVALNPNYPSAHQWLGQVLLYRGQMDEAIEHLQRATELDPLASIFLIFHGTGLRYAGRLTEANLACERALALQSDSVGALSSKCLTLVEPCRFSEALAMLHRLPSDQPRTLDIQLLAFARSGKRPRRSPSSTARVPPPENSPPGPAAFSL